MFRPVRQVAAQGAQSAISDCIFPVAGKHIFTSLPVGLGGRKIAISLCIFVFFPFVCPLAYFRSHVYKFHEIYYTCFPCPWLDPRVKVMQFFLPPGFVLYHPTVSAKQLMSGCPLAALVRSFVRTATISRCLMNGSSNLDETYRKEDCGPY